MRILPDILSVSLFGIIVMHHPSAWWHYIVLYFSCAGLMYSLVHVIANAVDVVTEAIREKAQKSVWRLD